MKIRSDYVSNSSSSSFILANSEIMDYFKITKDDIVNALIDSYGRKNYEDYVAKSRKYMDEHPDYYRKEKKYQQFGPFYVYDLHDKKERKIAEKCWGNVLDGWHATNCHRASDGNVEYDHGKFSRDYEKVVESLGEVYNFPGMLWDSDMIDGIQKFVRSDKKDPKTGMYGKYKPLDKEVKAFLKNFYKTCGVMTNIDVLRSSVGRFFVHFDENEIWTIKDSAKKSRKYESECYSYDRICEILFNYLVKNGRINPSDEKFKEKFKIPEYSLSKWDVENGWLYGFANGKSLTWRDLANETLTWCMHEG